MAARGERGDVVTALQIKEGDADSRSCIRIKEVNAVSRSAMLIAINSTTRNWPAAHPKPSNKRVCHETSTEQT